MKVKRYLLAVLAIAMLLGLVLPTYATVTPVDAAEDICILLQIGNPNMLVNQVETEIDPGRGTAPIEERGRTLVPVRAILESCDGTVVWESETQTVTLTRRTDEIKLVIGSAVAYINGAPHTLDVAPQVIHERTMLPIRVIAEGLHFNVFWDEADAVVVITNRPDAAEVVVPDNWKLSAAATNAEAFAGALRVHFIDVGQGDAIFAELPNGSTLLIDAGPSAGVVAPYIKGRGYDAITYVIATHPDADHIGGMAEVLNSFRVDLFYMPEKEHTTRTFERMLDAVENNGCEAVYARAGKEILHTPELTVGFVGPTQIYADNNNCSAVVKLTYKQCAFLFAGDAEVVAEGDMIAAGYDLKADVLKIGHHGSASSTSSAFLAAVRPKDAIISVGAKNRYGHPTADVLTALRDAGVSVHRTDEAGTIVVTSDGVQYTIE